MNSEVGIRRSSEARTQKGKRAKDPVAAKARSHKRRFLKRLGIRVPELDPTTAERLTDWSLARAMVDLATTDRTRVACFNSEQRALLALEERIDALDGRQSDPLAELAAQGQAIRERREQENA